MKISSCITLHGNCREAMEFYKDIFEIPEVEVKTFSDMSELFDNNIPSECENLIYRAELNIRSAESAFSIILGDSPSLIFFPNSGSHSNNRDNITYEISSSSKDWIESAFNELLDGGLTNIALQKKYSFELYGSLIDRYGICWIFCCNS